MAIKEFIVFSVAYLGGFSVVYLLTGNPLKGLLGWLVGGIVAELFLGKKTRGLIRDG